jgi:hypothetical protein
MINATLTPLTLLILQLNHLLDTGRYDTITLEDVTSHIEDGSILQFLKQRTGKDVDLSAHLEDGLMHGKFERFYVRYLRSLLNVADARRKWAVENRGLCLLIAMTNEIVQQGSGWSSADVAGVE